MIIFKFFMDYTLIILIIIFKFFMDYTLIMLIIIFKFFYGLYIDNIDNNILNIFRDHTLSYRVEPSLYIHHLVKG